MACALLFHRFSSNRIRMRVCFAANSKSGGWMIVWQAGVAGSIQLFAQGAGPIIQLILPAPLKLRHHQLNKIDEAFWSDYVREIETVHVGFIDPGFEFIGDARR